MSNSKSPPDKLSLETPTYAHQNSPAMLTRFVKNYIERHQNRANQLFHLVGVPVTFIVPWIVLAQTDNDWRWFWACFVFGYILQFIGHAIEGNDAGEVCLIKKMLGKPYREFRPGYEPAGTDATE